MSEQVVNKIDSFSLRISDLEGQIQELVKESGGCVDVAAPAAIGEQPLLTGAADGAEGSKA
jgi:uncharacterized protein (DUF779 family)